MFSDQTDTPLPEREQHSTILPTQSQLLFTFPVLRSLGLQLQCPLEVGSFKNDVT